MAIVSVPQTLHSFRARGKFGFGRGYGGSDYGHARYGILDGIGENIFYGRAHYGLTRTHGFAGVSGIYSRKRTLKGWAISRMKFYRPTNTQQPAQQAWRSSFADGMAQYALLTAPEKALLSKEGRKRNMLGFNLFMSRWLQSHRT